MPYAMAKNGPNCLKGPEGLRIAQMAQNDPKGPEWPSMAQNGPNGPEWPKMAQIGQK